MADIKKNIVEFLESNEDYSLLIEGKWGVGKTFLWKEIQEEQEKLNSSQKNVFQIFIDDFQRRSSFSNHLFAIVKFLFLLIPEIFHCLMQYLGLRNNKKQYKKFVYISLFGKEHYKQLLEEVLYKAYMRNKIILFLKKITLYGVSMESMLSLLTKDDLKNVIVCFDDIERKSYSLKIKDFLGLVFQLKEEKQCKVVLLSDSNKIQPYEKKHFDEYIEKVIDLTIKITDRKEIIKIILSTALKDIDSDLMPTNIYNIMNLRNLQRIIKGFKVFNKELDLSHKTDEYKEIIQYLFECIVEVINETDEPNNQLRIGYTLSEDSRKHIKLIVKACWKNYEFKVTEGSKEILDDEFKKHKIYKIRMNLQNIRRNLIKNNLSNESIQLYEKNILSIKKNEIKYFADIILYEFEDFMALVKVINSKKSTIKRIEKEIRKGILQFYVKINDATEQAIDMICDGDEKLLKLAKNIQNKKVNNKQIQNLTLIDKIPLNQLLLNRVSSYKDFSLHLSILNDENSIYTDDEIKKFLKDNKILLCYLTYFLSYSKNEMKVKDEYPRLYKIFKEIKN